MIQIKAFLRKSLRLSILGSCGLLANEEIRWDDLIAAFPPLSYYEKRYETVQKEVTQRFDKYFGNYQFSQWKLDRSDDDIKEEYLRLCATREQIWFDINTSIERSWRGDFRPCLELIQEDVVRSPNCICFDYNKINSYYNGSLVEEDGIRFLALEGPLDRTIPRFFDAIIETDAPLLIRLTPEQENGVEKCAPYWKGRLLKNDRLAIPRRQGSLMDCKNIFYLATDEWKDNAPVNAELLLNLVLKARSIYDPSKGPLAVHCSAGVGRTGTFIAGYCLIHEIDTQIASGVPINELQLSVERLVARLSLQRYYLVGRAPQYLNLHQMIQIYLEKFTPPICLSET